MSENVRTFVLSECYNKTTWGKDKGTKVMENINDMQNLTKGQLALKNHIEGLKRPFEVQVWYRFAVSTEDLEKDFFNTTVMAFNEKDALEQAKRLRRGIFNVAILNTKQSA